MFPIVDVCKAIVRGEYDNDLDMIRQAMSDRAEMQKRDKFWTFKVGDTVKFNSKTRPKYLVGIEGKIVEKRQTKVVVDIGDRHGRFGRQINVPVSLIDVV